MGTILSIEIIINHALFKEHCPPQSVATWRKKVKKGDPKRE